MGKKLLVVAAAVVCALGLAAGTSTAAGGKPSLIVFSVENLGDGSPACPSGSLFGLSFDLAGHQSLLGKGLSCVSSVEGCGTAGCHQTIKTTFTLDFFGRGKLTAPMVLSEFYLTDTLVLTRDHGTISAGTGQFAGARGTIDCVGTIRFTPMGPIPKIVCIVQLR